MRRCWFSIRRATRGCRADECSLPQPACRSSCSTRRIQPPIVGSRYGDRQTASLPARSTDQAVRALLLRRTATPPRRRGQVLHAAGMWPPSIPLLIDACHPRNYDAARRRSPSGSATEHEPLKRRAEEHGRYVKSARGQRRISQAARPGSGRARARRPRGSSPRGSPRTARRSASARRRAPAARRRDVADARRRDARRGRRDDRARARRPARRRRAGRRAVDADAR